jgi:transposase
MGILGFGPAGAARILADVGDVARFAPRWRRFAGLRGADGFRDPSALPPGRRAGVPGLGLANQLLQVLARLGAV